MTSHPAQSAPPTVYLVDDDDAFRDSLRALCESVGHLVLDWSSGVSFLDAYHDGLAGCLLLDIRMPEMSGLEVQQQLNARASTLPILLITGHGDVPLAVRAMKAGAYDFLQKPFSDQDLLDRIHEALRRNQGSRDARELVHEMRGHHDRLTPREHEVMELVVAGHANKVIASRLGISQRTIEIHRAQVMEKMHAQSLAELVRTAVALERAQNSDAERG